jgi:hypothetical protein
LPRIAQELAGGDWSVVAGKPDVEAALAWARQLDGWLEEPHRDEWTVAD